MAALQANELLTLGDIGSDAQPGFDDASGDAAAEDRPFLGSCFGAAEREGGEFEIGFLDGDRLEAEVADPLFGENDRFDPDGGECGWGEQRGRQETL